MKDFEKLAMSVPDEPEIKQEFSLGGGPAFGVQRLPSLGAPTVVKKVRVKDEATVMMNQQLE
jgi:hypothetical protein